MLQYGKYKKLGSSKIHSADECGICSEMNKVTKSGRRQHDKNELRKIIDEIWDFGIIHSDW